MKLLSLTPNLTSLLIFLGIYIQVFRVPDSESFSNCLSSVLVIENDYSPENKP